MGSSLSKDIRKPIKHIIDAWHYANSECRVGDGGTPYRIISKKSMPEALLVLVKTFLENGYRIEELDTSSVSILLINRCWKENVILKISRSDIAREKINLSEQWHELLHSPMYSGIKIAKLDESEKIVAVEKPIRNTIVKEEKIELPPTEEEMAAMANLADKLREGSNLNSPDDELDVDFLELMGVKCKDTNEQ